MVRYIIDVQGYKQRNNTFVFKEICIATIDLKDGYNIRHYLLKPPFPYQQLNQKEVECCKWLENNYHCLNWNFGFVEYYELEDIFDIIQEFDTVYVKGTEKKEWIEQYISCPITDLTDFNCPPIHFLKQYSPETKHCVINHGINCSFKNALLLLKWIQDSNI